MSNNTNLTTGNSNSSSSSSWNDLLFWKMDSSDVKQPAFLQDSSIAQEQLKSAHMNGTACALLKSLESIAPSEMNKPFHNGWSALFVAAGMGCVRIVQELITLGCDIDTVIEETTALQIAMQKFHETGRVNYLIIADLLSGVQEKNVQDYKISMLYKEHPINKQRAKTEESIQFLSEKKCLRVGCNKKVVVPYNYCGGRHKCCGENSVSSSSSLESHPSNGWKSLGENESTSLIFNFNSFSHGSFEMPTSSTASTSSTTSSPPSSPPSSPQRHKRSHAGAIEEDLSSLFCFDSSVTKRKECSSSNSPSLDNGPKTHDSTVPLAPGHHKIQNLQKTNFSQLFEQPEKAHMSCSFAWLQEMPKGNTTFRQCCDIVARDC